MLIKLKDFLGNEALVNLLQRAGLPPASLFCGPEGVGKKTLALSLASLVNCKNPAQDDRCGQCGACVKASKGNHPDILLFQPTKNFIRIQSMRKLSQEVQFRPFEGCLRFFVINEAEKMTEEASNSILKTLEEPPETSRIVLVTAFPQTLLPTIRSRCQTFPFRGLSREQIEAYLRKYGEQDNLRLRAAFANGSVAVALALDLEQTLRDRNQMLDLLTAWCRHESFELLYNHCERDPLRADLKLRDRVRVYFDLLQFLLEDLYFFLVDTPERVVNQDHVENLRELSQGTELDWIRSFLYHISQAKRELAHNINPLICFEALWLNNCKNKTYVGSRHGQV